MFVLKDTISEKILVVFLTQNLMVKYGVRSPKFIWAPCVQLYSLTETPQLPPLPPHLGSYTRSLLVSQDRRHLFVTTAKSQFTADDNARPESHATLPLGCS